VDSRPAPGRRVAWFAAALFSCIGLNGCGGTAPPPFAGNASGFRRMLMPEITEGVRIGEVFAMNADGLTAIDIRPSQVGPPRGKIRIRILPATPDTAPTVRITDIPAVDLVRGGVFRFEFPPFPDSTNVRYLLEITSSPDAPAGGVAFWATKGRGNPEDVLLFNGVDRFADLVYQTDAIFPPVVSPLRPAVWLALVALALSWIALMYVLRGLAS
jgi:hypothetical protein